MNKNTFLYGVIIALVIPLLGYALWMGINYGLKLSNVLDKSGEIFQFSQKTIVLVAVCFNLIPFHHAKNKRWDNMLRSVGLITISMMFGWAFYFDVIKI